MSGLLSSGRRYYLLLRRFALPGWMLQECTGEILLALTVWDKAPNFLSTSWQRHLFWLLVALWWTSELPSHHLDVFVLLGFLLIQTVCVRLKQVIQRWVSPWNMPLLTCLLLSTRLLLLQKGIQGDSLCRTPCIWFKILWSGAVRHSVKALS